MSNKLGCILPKIDPTKHKMFADYVRRREDGTLPVLPAQEGHETCVASNAWGYLLNDQVGDCVIAGILHQVMEATAEGTGTPISVTDANAKAMYMKITGWDGIIPPDQTDQGTDPTTAYEYWQNTGFPDANGNLHKIAGYLVIPFQDSQGNSVWTDTTLEELYYAIYLFGGGGFCFTCTDVAQQQFQEGQVWTVVPSATPEGGHYVYLVAKREYPECVTWGQIQPMTEEFIQYYGSAFLIPVPEDIFNKQGVSPEGFDLAQLQVDLSALNGIPDPTPAPSPNTTNFLFTIGNDVAVVNGVNQQIDATNPAVVPVISQGRTFVPARFITDNLKGTTTWDPNKKQVTLTIPTP